MRALTRQRRTAAICGACAAIVPSSALLMTDHPNSSPTHFFGGLVIGVAFSISVGTFVLSRRRARAHTEAPCTK